LAQHDVVISYASHGNSRPYKSLVYSILKVSKVNRQRIRLLLFLCQRWTLSYDIVGCRRQYRKVHNIIKPETHLKR